MNKKQGIFLLAILAAALIFRIIFSSAVVGIDAEPRGDEIDYMAIADNIAQGNGFQSVSQHPTARRPPLYPLFLAGWFKLFGTSIVLGRMLQWLLGTVIVCQVFLLGRRVFSTNTALLAACATACNPFLIFICAYTLTENLYIVFLMTLLLLFTGYIRDGGPSVRRAALSGAVLGLASLCRPTAFFLWLFIVAALLLFMRERLVLRARTAAVFMAVLGVTLLPWAWRNHAVFDSWVLFTTHGGITFYQSNNQAVVDIPQYRGSVAPLYALPEYDRLGTLDEIAKDEEAWRLGKQFLAENPRLIPALTIRKFQRFWRFRSEMGMSGIKSGWWWSTDRLAGRLASRLDVGLVYAGAVIPFFLFGLLGAIRRYKQLWIWYGVIIVHTLLALVFFGSLRTRLPIEPVIALMAAAGLSRLVRRFRPAVPAGNQNHSSREDR